MSEAWAETVGTALVRSNTDETRQPSCSQRHSPSTKPSATQKAIIAELGLRYPPPRDADPDLHAGRIRLLASDCADIPPEILRPACQAAARENTFLPSAAEIRRHAKGVADQRSGVGSEGWLQSKIRERNLQSIADGSPIRCIVIGDRLETFRVGVPGERRRCDGRGGVIVPYWSRRLGDWVYP